ncbi:MAG: hypothetical protein Pg6C_03880 [Treponemataceae bacterium]|nr:MAG: hypothetical protein Pg6C_03880 [Treponemataceae bacterium]
MKKFIVTVVALSALLAGNLCAKGGQDKTENTKQPTKQPQQRYFSGDGGKGKSITIIQPKADGLAAGQDYIPALVQGEFISNFSSYSAISVFNRQQLEAQYAELESLYYDGDAGSDIGNLPPTDYFMSGSVTKTASGYSLQITVAKNADKMVAASYSGTCTFAELDNLTAVRKASADLLGKLNVSLSDTAKQELAAAANAAAINAQTTLAQGITAQKSGTVVEALSYYFQAAGYDPGLAEAASRLNIMSADISSGNIGQNARNDIQWRKDWVARLTECEQFFDNYIKDYAPSILMYSTDLEQGNIDYAKETVSLSGMKIAFYPQSMQWFQTLEKVVETVRQGLEKTGRAKAWGLDWPNKRVSDKAGETGRERPNWEKARLVDMLDMYQSIGSPLPPEYLNRMMDVSLVGNRQLTLNVVMELKNERGAVIGRKTLALLYGVICRLEETGYKVYPDRGEAKAAAFDAVKAADISDRLNIAVSSIDGISAEQAARTKHISVVASDDYYKSRGGPFENGQKGPAGGILFTDGLRWFEAAPARTEFQAGSVTRPGYEDAVKKCRQMNYGGKTDWHLPDRMALEGMYRNLKMKGLGGFDKKDPGSYYFSPPVRNPSTVDGYFTIINFLSGSDERDGGVNKVRAVREF